jgi:hypothetical protein
MPRSTGFSHTLLGRLLSRVPKRKLRRKQRT